MTSEQVGEANKKAKRRGRPKGSKNMKKRGTQKKLGRPPGRKNKRITTAGNRTSFEETIRRLLTFPTSAETKIRLIQATWTA